MPAVSDSSTLILFARIGSLELLRDVFGQVIVPPAVWYEVVTAGAERPGTADLVSAPWIRRQGLARPESVLELPETLHPGEAEAIALAGELFPHASILIDDLKARRVAAQRRLRVVGTAGVLVLAKSMRKIDAVRPLLDVLRDAGLYLGDAAVREILLLANEAQTEQDMTPIEP